MPPSPNLRSRRVAIVEDPFFDHCGTPLGARSPGRRDRKGVGRTVADVFHSPPRPRRGVVGRRETDEPAMRPTERIGRRSVLPRHGHARNACRGTGSYCTTQGDHLHSSQYPPRSGSRATQARRWMRSFRTGRVGAPGTVAVRCRRWRSWNDRRHLRGVISSAPWPKPICASSPGRWSPCRDPIARAGI